MAFYNRGIVVKKKIFSSFFLLMVFILNTVFAQSFPDGGHGMVIERLEAEKSSIISGDTTRFTVSVRLRNRTDERLTGIRLAAALINNNNEIVEVIGTFNAGGLGAGNQYTSTINCFVSAAAVPGKYRLIILSRHDSVAANDWRINSVSLTGVPSNIDFEVIAAPVRTSTQMPGAFPPAPYQPKTSIRTLLWSQTTVNEYTFNAGGNRTIKIFYCFCTLKKPHR